jgi:hypothetical protein
MNLAKELLIMVFYVLYFGIQIFNFMQMALHYSLQQLTIFCKRKGSVQR